MADAFKCIMIVRASRCRLRVLDSFGTEAEFNFPPYFAAHKTELGGKVKNVWGGHRLNLQQFFTMFRKQLRLWLRRRAITFLGRSTRTFQRTVRIIRSWASSWRRFLRTAPIRKSWPRPPPLTAPIGHWSTGKRPTCGKYELPRPRLTDPFRFCSRIALLGFRSLFGRC